MLNSHLNFKVRMKKIKNQFLISMPKMSDSIFEKSIIYICEQQIDGYMGIIINKPISNKNEVIDELGSSSMKNIKDIYFGGPVKINRGLILHANDYNNEGTIKISTNISLTSNDKIINDINIGLGPENYKFIVGYSGWSKGQLENEIENGDWLLSNLNEKYIFQKNDEKKWENAYKDLGLKIKMFTGGNSGIS